MNKEKKEASVMNLEITTSEKTESFEVEWIEVQATNGSFLIYPEHMPIISEIKNNGQLSFKQKSGAIGTMTLERGLLFMDGENYIQIISWVD